MNRPFPLRPGAPVLLSIRSASKERIEDQTADGIVGFALTDLLTLSPESFGGAKFETMRASWKSRVRRKKENARNLGPAKKDNEQEKS